MTLDNLIALLRAGAVLAAAAMLGNWFLAELRAARRKGGPWYAAYLSLPGILILASILLPVLFWLAAR